MQLGISCLVATIGPDSQLLTIHTWGNYHLALDQVVEFVAPPVCAHFIIADTGFK